MEIDHASGFGQLVFIFGQLINIVDGEPEQFVAQRREELGLFDPDDDFKFQGAMMTSPRLYASGNPGSGLSKLPAASSPSVA